MKTRPITLLGGLLALAALALTARAAVQAAGPAQSSADFHQVTVKEGENLATYARIYGVTGTAILAANRQIIDGNLIYPGQVITIPVVKTFTPSLTTPFFYTAQGGDTLFSVAAKFELHPDAITRANGTSSFIAGVTYLMPAGPHLYYLQPGDTLATVAARYGTTIGTLLSVNNLPNPDVIYAGQPIFVPILYNATPIPITAPVPNPVTPTPTPVVPVATTAAVKTPTPAATAVPSSFIRVTVRAGDSLVTYVLRYGVSASSLLAANPKIWANPNIIYPGDEIIIPVHASNTPSRTTPFFYVIGGGETINTIAAKFEMLADTLSRANPGVPFVVGGTILVPAGPHVYTVKVGDELRTIAPLYGTTVEALLTYNNLPNPDFIYPGQQIFIPIRYNAAPLPYN